MADEKIDLTTLESTEVETRQVVAQVRDMAEDERAVIAYVSAKTVDSYGTVLTPDSWDMARFDKGPRVMWSHEYDQMPIGRSMWHTPDAFGLLAKPSFREEPFADEIYNAYKGDYLNGFSVGFKPHELVRQGEEGYDELVERWEVEGEPAAFLTRNELFEYSAVPIPSNPDALTIALERGVISPQTAKRMYDGLVLNFRTFARGVQSPLTIPDDTVDDVLKGIQGLDIRMGLMAETIEELRACVESFTKRDLEIVDDLPFEADPEAETEPEPDPVETVASFDPEHMRAMVGGAVSRALSELTGKVE